MEKEPNTQRLAGKICRLDKCSDLIWKQSEELSLYLVSRNVCVLYLQTKCFPYIRTQEKPKAGHSISERPIREAKNTSAK